jgi:phosphatidate cytidylyltransferase
MKRLLTALILIPTALLAIFRAPDPLFSAVVATVAMLAIVEYLQVVEHFGFAVQRAVTYFLATVPFLLLISWKLLAPSLGPVMLFFLLFMILVFAPAIYLMAQLRQNDLRQVLPGAALSFFSVPYIAGAFIALAMLRMVDHGWFFVLLCCAAVWVGDSAAYYVGRRWGKRKFSPVISPNKSWEGAIASVVGAMLIVVIFNAFSPQVEQGLKWAHLLDPLANWGSALTPAPWWLAALAGAILNVAAQLGDLFESMIKRGAGVKDSGNTLPGHGGMLDRVDALLFASPVALIFFGVVGAKFLRAIL